MKNTPSDVTLGSNAAAAKPEAHTAEMRQIIRKEIRAKWGKFSEQDLSGLKGKDDLVTQIVAKYGTEKGQAQREVNTFLDGRQF